MSGAPVGAVTKTGARPEPSSTVLVQNLTEFTREEQVHELLSLSGHITRIVMGIFSDTRTPAGYCFVIFDTPKAARDCVKYQCATRLDDKNIDVRIAPEGFVEGRQFCSREDDLPMSRKRPAEDMETPEGRRVRARRSNKDGLGAPSLAARVKHPMNIRIRELDDGGGMVERPSTGECVRRLSLVELELYTRNPHLKQVFCNGGELARVKPMTMADRLCCRELQPRRKYSRRKNQAKTTVMWRERGVALSMIDFLLTHGHKSNTVVVAGAAAASAHFTFLSEEMFPKHTFHLYDEETDEMSFRCNESSRVYIHQEAFTTETAKKYAPAAEGKPKSVDTEDAADDGEPDSADEREHRRILNDNSSDDDDDDEADKSDRRRGGRHRRDARKDKAAADIETPVLFCCFVNTGDAGAVGKPFDDMLHQEEWATVMQPAASLLRFRLPYCPPPGQTNYFDGDLLFPTWHSPTATEALIMVTDTTARQLYDHEAWEGFMFHFNTITRTSYYELDPGFTDEALKEGGLDHCRDCAVELCILRAFVTEFQEHVDGDKEIAERVLRLSERLSKACAGTYEE
eukprot:m.1144021 g.1144021  ORF g.1144021 m.1144021 type:complete len:572 (-) comp24461_c0_seq10:2595-4310(-)